ncbi:MAG: DUF2339 domain-containing protein [Acetatifactor sp.]|nr:DUF2339 domain-containing protein [Acetatifactor sp.]
MDNKMEQRPLGKLEQLEADVSRLAKENNDPAFSNYLRDVRNKLINQKYQIDLLREDLDRNCRMLEERKGLAGELAPTSETTNEAKVQEAITGQEQPVQYGRFSHGGAPAAEMGQQAFVYQAVPVVSPTPSRTRVVKKNTEFIVGATILGVIGGIFILMALVMLSMNFMSGLVKGISLYAICLIILLLSELLVYRKLPKLGITLSSVAIGGLYITTAVNFLSLRILNMWVALGIAFFITIMVIVLSRRRNSLFYRILGIAAAYLSFFMLEQGITGTEFLVISVMILCINVLTIVLPVSKRQTAFRITHMSLNTVFTLFFSMRALYCGVESELALVFEVLSIMILHALFVMQLLYHKREAETAVQEERHIGGNAGILTAYCICGIAQILDISGLILNMKPYTTYLLFFSYGTKSDLDREFLDLFARTCGHAVMLSIFVICLVSFLILRKNKCQERWFIYYFLNLAPWGIYLAEKRNVTYSVVLVLLIMSKLLSLKKIKEVRAVEAILTTVACLIVMWGRDPEILLIGIVVAILCLSQWKTYHEVVLTAALVFYLGEKMPDSLSLPVVVGLLFVGILLFNNVKRWRDDHILVYNVLAVAGQAILFLTLISAKWWVVDTSWIARTVEEYRKELMDLYITYFFMLIFGLATIVLTFKEKYRMRIRGKELVVAGYLTYMALVLPTSETIVASILLMVIALVCVGVGFTRRHKPIRIYGLVLSLVVCGKLVLYDFLEVPILQKTILFFVVGVMALIIAGIYIILEKRAVAQNSAQNMQVIISKPIMMEPVGSHVENDHEEQGQPSEMDQVTGTESTEDSAE